jgi:hypothetical protein
LGRLFLRNCPYSGGLRFGPDYVRPSAPEPAKYKELKGWKQAAKAIGFAIGTGITKTISTLAANGTWELAAVARSLQAPFMRAHGTPG